MEMWVCSECGHRDKASEWTQKLGPNGEIVEVVCDGCKKILTEAKGEKHGG